METAKLWKQSTLLILVEGVMLGCVVALYNANEVLMAVGITVVLVLGLTIFALQTKIDFTAMGKSYESFVRKRALVKYQSQSEVIKVML